MIQDGLVDNSEKIIYDLCGGTGAWSDPYAENGYDRRIITLPNMDVRLYEYIKEEVYGVLCAPPCNHLAGSGARWWKEKGEKALIDALSVADACMRIVSIYKPVFWALENPVGRLRRFYGNPELIFNPCDYGDPYTKKTLLWGNFNTPKRNYVEPKEGSKMHLLPPSKNRAALRSITPPRFAQAFFEANQ